MSSESVSVNPLLTKVSELFDPELIPLVGQGLTGLGPTGPGAAETAMPDDSGTGTGQVDLVILAEMLGQALYQGPLLDTITATGLLSASGGGQHVTGAAKGTGIALAVRDECATDVLRPGMLVMPPDRSTITGRRCFVSFAAEVDQILVVAAGEAPDDAVNLALIPRVHSSVKLRRYEETGRGELYEVTFDGTPVTAWLTAGEQWPQALAGARLRQAAYLVGLAQGALDLAVEYAKAGYQLGRQIGRFQALAFRLSELSLRIDALRLLVADSALRADQGRDSVLEAAQCLATAADLALLTTSAGMQIHGAKGMTTESDAQLFYRRALVEALWLGTPTQLRGEAVPLLADQVTG